VLTVSPARPEEAAEIAELYIASRREIPDVVWAHDDDDVRNWIPNILMKTADVLVARDGDTILGMMALTPGWLDQLYVASSSFRRGVGAALMHAAQQRQNALKLWAFRANVRARAFYASHGFREVLYGDGASNEERAADVLMTWRG
jgi:GNAT superfamily N-acetyltransferase